MKWIRHLELEAVVQRCSVKWCSLKFRKIHWKTPVSEFQALGSDP